MNVPLLLMLAAAPTFNKDVAGILYDNCTSCHRPGEVAPFSLLTYQDAAKRAALIATVTGKRIMPPWKAEPGYGHFSNERVLSEEQIATIARWAKAGAPEGKPADRPKPPVYAEGWQAGTPDLVVTLPGRFPVPADGRDVFQCFVIPTDRAEETFVKTAEFRPGNRRVVHHALFFLDTSGTARKLDAGTPEPGYPCFGGPRFLPTGGLGGWAPGAAAQPLPEGAASILPKGADIVVQIHYHPSGKPEEDQSAAGFTFTTKPTRGIATVIAGSRRIDIQPGETHYEVKDTAMIPSDVEAFGITPHAHYLCKEMKVDAHLPDGTVTPLIRIKDWDFNWQGQYRYAEPVKLPKGTRVEMRYIYDNSASNPRNPSNPPRRVLFGEQTTDEMAIAFLSVLLPSPGDVGEFRRAMLMSRLEQIINEDADPIGLNPGQRAVLQGMFRMVDKNGNGKLDPDEAQALMEFMRRRP